MTDKVQKYPYAVSVGSGLRIVFQDYPGVEACLDEPQPLFNRPERRGRVSYSISGDLTAAAAREFAGNIMNAASLAIDWERGEETFDTLWERFKMQGAPKEGEGN